MNGIIMRGMGNIQSLITQGYGFVTYGFPKKGGYSRRRNRVKLYNFNLILPKSYEKSMIFGLSALKMFEKDYQIGINAQKNPEEMLNLLEMV